jgi:hypothetical protein
MHTALDSNLGTAGGGGWRINALGLISVQIEKRINWNWLKQSFKFFHEVTI